MIQNNSFVPSSYTYNVVENKLQTNIQIILMIKVH